MKDIARYGMPIKIFYANMLKIGLTISAVDGQLKVGGDRSLLTPVIKDEIIKRKDQLVELLTPAPSDEMAPYFGRLLKLDELKTALYMAERMQDRVDSFPVNGGWLLVTAKYANEVPATIKGIKS